MNSILKLFVHVYLAHMKMANIRAHIHPTAALRRISNKKDVNIKKVKKL